MEPREALKWTLLYRGISIGAFVLGGVLIAAGVFLGFASAVRTLFTDPAGAVEAANPLVTIAFGVLGLAVWQVGKTYALFVTVPQAAGRAAAEEFDTEHLRSELLESIDDHLSDLKVDVEETRRNVQELKRAEHAAEFDETDVLGSSAGAAIGASGGTATKSDRPAGDSSSASNSSPVSNSSPGTSSTASSADRSTTTSSPSTASKSGGTPARASDSGGDGASKTPPSTDSRGSARSSPGSNVTGSGSAGVGGSGRADSTDTRRSGEPGVDRSTRSASDPESSTRSKPSTDASSDEGSPSRTRRRDSGSGDDEDETDDPLA